MSSEDSFLLNYSCNVQNDQFNIFWLRPCRSSYNAIEKFEVAKVLKLVFRICLELISSDSRVRSRNPLDVLRFFADLTFFFKLWISWTFLIVLFHEFFIIFNKSIYVSRYHCTEPIHNFCQLLTSRILFSNSLAVSKFCKVWLSNGFSKTRFHYLWMTVGV